MAVTTEYAWYIERDRLGLVEKVSGEWKSVTEDNKDIRVFCTALAAPFKGDTEGDLDSSSEVPAQFHEALAYKVIASGYEEPRNLNPEMAMYFTSKYEQVVKQGKKHGRTLHVSSRIIKQQDF